MTKNPTPPAVGMPAASGPPVAAVANSWPQDSPNAGAFTFTAECVNPPCPTGRYPTVLTPEQFVDALFVGAGFTPTPDERKTAADEFGGSPTTEDTAARARALRRVAENETFARREMTTAFVLMEYFGYLRRDPDEAGFRHWLDKLNAFSGNFVRAEMVKAFITSIEYRARFGPS